MVVELDATEPALVVLSHRVPLNAEVRYSIIKDLERVTGRFEYLDMLQGQLIENIQQAGMLPCPANAEKTTKRYCMYQFCKARGLPLWAFRDAMKAVPN